MVMPARDIGRSRGCFFSLIRFTDDNSFAVPLRRSGIGSMITRNRKRHLAEMARNGCSGHYILWSKHPQDTAPALPSSTPSWGGVVLPSCGPRGRWRFPLRMRDSSERQGRPDQDCPCRSERTSPMARAFGRVALAADTRHPPLPLLIRRSHAPQGALPRFI